MKMQRKSALLMVGFVLAAFTAWGDLVYTPPRVEDFLEDAKHLEKLERGKILKFKKAPVKVKGGMIGGGTAVGIIDRPPEAVWKHVTAVSKHPEFMPRLVKNRLDSQEGGVNHLEQTLRIFGKKITYNLIQEVDDTARTLTWRLDHEKENDIRETLGSWIVQPYGSDQTIAVYSVLVDSGMPIPAWIENFLTRRDLPNVVKALKRRAESDGAYKK